MFIVSTSQMQFSWLWSSQSHLSVKFLSYFVFVSGLRQGKIYESTTPQPYEPNFQWTITFPFYFPKRLVAVGLVQLYLQKFDYGIDRAFKQLNCNSKVIKVLSEFITSSVSTPGIEWTFESCVTDGCYVAPVDRLTLCLDSFNPAMLAQFCHLLSTFALQHTIILGSFDEFANL